MIEAAFHLASANVIPVYLPDGEVIEIARMAGIPEDDLFRIDVPAGLSREARVLCLVSGDSISRLYANVGAYGTASATFKWRSSEADTEMELPVSLLPPRPLYVVPQDSGARQGVYVVEAVDVRYWWKRQQSVALTDDPQFGTMYSSDGRSRSTAQIEVSALATAMKDKLGVSPSLLDLTLFFPSTVMRDRLADQLFTPECSLAMALDLLFSQTGWVAMWDFTLKKFIPTYIDDQVAELESFMSDYKIAVANGLEAGSGVPPSEPLAQLWHGNTNMQRNRMPSQVAFSHPFRGTESMTRYDNDPNPTATGFIPFPIAKEYAIVNDISTAQARPSLESVLSINEPRPLVAREYSSPTLTPWPFTSSTPSNNINTAYWPYVGYQNNAKNLLKNRCESQFGRVVWGGWANIPRMTLRTTMCRFKIGRRNGALVPLTVTDADEKDWLLGPDGLRPDDPREIVLGKGMAHARRLGSGVVTVDVPPPMCRVFAAIVTGSTRLGVSGNSYWQWSYQLTEVQPRSGAGQSSSGWQGRVANAAMNLCEDGNIYQGAGNANNVIATGVRQADVTNAVIDALPICNGTTVLAVEQFCPASSATNAPPYRVWFSLPNAVKVTCVTPFTGDDYGTFADAAPIFNDYGTFEAPEIDTDYGWFTDDYGSFALPSALYIDYGTLAVPQFSTDYGVFT